MARRSKASSSSSSASSYPALTGFLAHEDPSYHADFPADEVRSALLSWYKSNRRRLPWRGDAPPYSGSTAGVNKGGAAAHVPAGGGGAGVSAYGVWVSEIMCQQTRVEAVIPYWLAWMEAFPTVQALADASEEAVNARWAGLGFYRRARMLHEGARQVVSDFGGELPADVDGLLKLKGVGPYTAGAIASIVHDAPAPIVDGNVLRLMARLCAVASHVKHPAYCADDKLAWKLARSLVEAGGGCEAGDLNQGLMELGATLCAPDGTGTDSRDPLAPFYKSCAIGRDAYAAAADGVLLDLIDEYTSPPAAGGQPRGVHNCAVCKAGADAFIAGLRELATAGKCADADGAAAYVHSLLPMALPKKARREERLVVAALHRGEASGEDAEWLLVRRADDGLLAGQWEFPSAVVAVDRAEETADPGEGARAEAMEAVLRSVGVEPSTDLVGRQGVGGVVEHIFSHVRHSMHIEHARVAEEGEASASVSTEGRPLEWMGSARMAQVGVTAGVKKVIGAVAGGKGKGKAASGGAGKKRKQAAAPEKAQPKLSAFFGKSE